MNNVNLIGRIVNDLELRNVGQDLTVLSFAIAINERRNGKDESSFFDITAWSKQAETIAQYFRKGQRIGLSGKLRQERWQDKDGGNRSRVNIVLREFFFIEPKDGGNTGAGNYQNTTGGTSNKDGGYSKQNTQSSNSNSANSTIEFDNFPGDNITDGEVPF